MTCLIFPPKYPHIYIYHDFFLKSRCTKWNLCLSRVSIDLSTCNFSPYFVVFLFISLLNISIGNILTMYVYKRMYICDKFHFLSTYGAHGVVSQTKIWFSLLTVVTLQGMCMQMSHWSFSVAQPIEIAGCLQALM